MFLFPVNTLIRSCMALGWAVTTLFREPIWEYCLRSPTTLRCMMCLTMSRFHAGAALAAFGGCFFLFPSWRAARFCGAAKDSHSKRIFNLSPRPRALAFCLQTPSSTSATPQTRRPCALQALNHRLNRDSDEVFSDVNLACWVFSDAAAQVLRLCRALYQHELRPSAHDLERSLELHLLFVVESDARSTQGSAQQ